MLMTVKKLNSAELELSADIIDLSHKLLAQGLVVRTWGNFSSRLDANSFLITPSGKAYTRLQPKDQVKINLLPETTEIVSPGKPSSEMPMHAIVYRLFPEVNYVVHTHQIFASALSLYGNSFPLSGEYAAGLGGETLPLAGYALPGTSKLHRNMQSTLEQSRSKCILMERHGALVLASSKEEAIARAALLEEFARETFAELSGKEALNRSSISHNESEEKITQTADKRGKGEICVQSRDPLVQDFLKSGLSPYLDDFAQICGPAISDRRGRNSVVFDPEKGCALCFGKDELDAYSVRAVLEKNARAAHIARITQQKPIVRWESILMRFVYQKKYSKKAEG